mmetsp:Transcript_18506/g.24450  ORF Transcript_18506/g.24450 Transcript_18506/m.24450 type:complete len:211 (+) Transcript_18506:88-720(+)
MNFLQLSFFSACFVCIAFLLFSGSYGFQHQPLQSRSKSARKNSPQKLYMAKYDYRFSPNRWSLAEGPIEPGFGGPWPGDPDAPKFKVTVRNLDEGKEISHMVPADRYIYFQMEDDDIDVPLVNNNSKRMCRNGCCTTCAVKVVEGKFKQDTQLGLMKELRKKGYALLCCAYPRSDMVVEVQKEDEVYQMQFGEYFESGGVEWGGFLPEDD